MNPSARVQFYTDKAGEWRWRLVTANGNLIADSGEGYKRLGDAINGWQAVTLAASQGVAFEVEADV